MTACPPVCVTRLSRLDYAQIFVAAERCPNWCLYIAMLVTLGFDVTVYSSWWQTPYAHGLTVGGCNVVNLGLGVARSALWGPSGTGHIDDGVIGAGCMCGSVCSVGPEFCAGRIGAGRMLLGVLCGARVCAGRIGAGRIGARSIGESYCAGLIGVDGIRVTCD